MGDQRVEALRAALKVAPDDFGLGRMLAEALITAERNDEAVVELKRLVATNPSDASVKLMLAECYARSGQPGAASVVLDEIERSGSMSTEAWRLRGTLLGAPRLTEDGPLAPPEPVEAAPVTTPAPRAPSPAEAAPSPSGPQPASSPDDPERPSITFADVGGMDALKEQIRLKIVYPARQPEIYAAYGKKSGGGLLLYGPPGCGKTYLARATAGELGAAFISVGVADVLEMFIGSSERNLKAVFATARAHQPAVLFFDEVDALAADRAAFKSTAGRSVINQFLAEMDGIGADNSGLLILAATNAPWHVDPAFRRPGRFDDVLFVPPPDEAARASILAVMLRNRPVADMDVERIAQRTDGFSGADLRGVVERALERKLALSLRDGQIRPITTADLIDATRGVSATTKEWFATVRNYLMYANQSGLYDPVRPYLTGR
jgi:transitional endoplasmic reticulum ATPase